MDHFIIMALMDQLRTEGVLTTPKITEILDAARENFVEYKERMEAQIYSHKGESVNIEP